TPYIGAASTWKRTQKTKEFEQSSDTNPLKPIGDRHLREFALYKNIIFDFTRFEEHMHGNLGRHAMEQLIRTIAGNDVVLRESLEAEAQALLDDLAGLSPSKHRLMLAKHVVCCWLQVRHFDLVSPPIDDAMSDRFRRWQREAGNRYGQAVKLLHDLTKMEGRRARQKRRQRW
ncbi:MAG: hypothetical protein RJP95_02790, partial [Pirellulales bacterium]